MTLQVRMSGAIDDAWCRLEPVPVGRKSRAAGSPCRFVTVSDADRLLLRIDVHSDGPECRAFEQAIVWRGSVIFGYGERVHAVCMRDRSVVTFDTQPYFGALHATREYLLIASGSRLIRVEPNRTVRWTSGELGVDGVVVRDADAVAIHGDGEWDPPGGWRSFELRACDGSIVSQG